MRVGKKGKNDYQSVVWENPHSNGELRVGGNLIYGFPGFNTYSLTGHKSVVIVPSCSLESVFFKNINAPGLHFQRFI